MTDFDTNGKDMTIKWWLFITESWNFHIKTLWTNSGLGVIQQLDSGGKNETKICCGRVWNCKHEGFGWSCCSDIHVWSFVKFIASFLLILSSSWCLLHHVIHTFGNSSSFSGNNFLKNWWLKNGSKSCCDDVHTPWLTFIWKTQSNRKRMII